MSRAESTHTIRLLGKTDDGRRQLGAAVEVARTRQDVIDSLVRLPLRTKSRLVRTLDAVDCPTAARVIGSLDEYSRAPATLVEALGNASHSERRRAAQSVRRKATTDRALRATGAAVGIDAPLLAIHQLQPVFSSPVIGLWFAVPGLVVGAIASGLLPMGQYQTRIRAARLSEAFGFAHRFASALVHVGHLHARHESDVAIFDAVDAAALLPAEAELASVYGLDTLDEAFEMVAALTPHDIDQIQSFDALRCEQRVAWTKLNSLMANVIQVDDPTEEVATATTVEAEEYRHQLDSSRHFVTSAGALGLGGGLGAMTTAATDADVVVGSVGMVGAALALTQRGMLARRNRELAAAIGQCNHLDSVLEVRLAQVAQPFAIASERVAQDPVLRALVTNLALSQHCVAEATRPVASLDPPVLRVH